MNQFKFTNQELLTKLEQKATHLNQSELVKSQKELLKIIFQWLLENPQVLADLAADEKNQEVNKLILNMILKDKLCQNPKNSKSK